MKPTDDSKTPPILFLAFNRPAVAARAFEQIRLARPRRLFLAVDGPRPNRPEESDNVDQVRRLADRVDWDCSVQTLFRDSNLGCKLAVSEAISWFFENVEEGIILEDDCIADPSFFQFVGELLEHYRDNKQVMMISGDNFQLGRIVPRHSYYFSRYTHIWGWATWRRAWRLYDYNMTKWPELRRNGWLNTILEDRRAVAYWTSVFDETHREMNDAWDYRWTFAAWANDGLTVLPGVNLVSNIGFGAESTNNWRRSNPVAALPVRKMEFPLDHPALIERDASADEFSQRLLFTRPLWRKLGRAVYRRFFRRAV